MRKRITLVALLCLTVTLLSAQLYPQYTAYRTKADKKFSFYQRQAKQQLKKLHYRRAAINAVHALETTEKKKQAQKIGELLAEVYPLAISTTEKSITGLQLLSATADVDRKVALQHEIWRTYNEINYLINNYQQLPSDRQVANSEQSPYFSQQKQAASALKTAKIEAAAFHYQNALALPADNHWEMRLAKARAIKIAHHYAPDYQDVKAKLAEARTNAQVTIHVEPLINQTVYRPAYQQDYVAKNTVKSAMDNEKYIFARLARTNEQPDVEVRFTIKNVRFSDRRITETKDDHKKIIDKEKEDVAKGTMTTYNQYIGADVDYHYTIIDVVTNDVLKTNTGTISDVRVFEDSWYKYVGDKRALSKSQLRKLQEDYRPEPVPSQSVLFSESLFAAREQTGKHTVEFCDLIGH